MENAALLLCGLQVFEEKHPTDVKHLEKRLGELLPCWMNRLMTEEEFKKFNCVFEEKPNIITGGKWTLASHLHCVMSM